MRRKKVLWIGPKGKINCDDDNELLKMLKHEVLEKTYEKKELKETYMLFEKAIKHLRRLYRTHNLTSLYHSFSHNFVTAITSLKAYIGALKLGKKLSISDLQKLVLAALFHDTGYLRKSKFQKRTNIKSHADKSGRFCSNFLKVENWSEKEIKEVLSLLKFTNYSKWNKNEDKVCENVLAQILVGADFLQVVDANYIENIKVLDEFIYERAGKVSKSGQQKFYHLTCKITFWIWSYLDSLFNGIKKNPYRIGWGRYRKNFEEAFGLPEFV